MDSTTNDVSVRTHSRRRAFVTLLALNCLVLVPGWILSGRLGPHWIALEAVIVVGLFLYLPRGRWTALASVATAVATLVALVLALGDTAARMSLARPLNLYLDLRLVSSIGDLLRGTLGQGWSVLVATLALLLAGALLVGLALALRGLTGGLRGAVSPRFGLALVAVGLAAVPLRWIHPSGVVLGLPVVTLAREQGVHLRRMLQERERFAAEMAEAPFRLHPASHELPGLGGRDVILAFIESYGMTAIEDQRYAPVLEPRLDALEMGLREAGLHIVTGRLVAPSQGGMSWLGHGSMLSGLWLDNQLRYDLLLASEHPTLVDDFRAAGYRTAALMPAITLAWPEGVRFGYDEIFARADIDYAGPPLNWVTMPDQFTWSFLEQAIRSNADPRPLFAEIGFISSHAPWTPILEVIDDWDSIGDGAVFQRWDGAGERPDELWRDGDRVREHYARSVAYAVDAMAGYARRYIDDDVLLIVLGDHQPAPLITGDDAPRTVPVHVISSDRALLEPFEAWGFTDGSRPPDGVEPERMSAFRPWFLATFSSAPTGGTATRAESSGSTLEAPSLPAAPGESGAALGPVGGDG